MLRHLLLFRATLGPARHIQIAPAPSEVEAWDRLMAKIDGPETKTRKPPA